MVFLAQLLNVMVGPGAVITARVSRLIRMANNILVVHLLGGWESTLVPVGNEAG